MEDSEITRLSDNELIKFKKQIENEQQFRQERQSKKLIHNFGNAFKFI